MSLERPDAPFERPEICLDPDDLAAIGRITMIEARSMAMAAASLKGAAGLSADSWKNSHYWQFAQICQKLLVASKSIDQQLWEAAVTLNERRLPFQDGRNAIVHAMWGTGENGEPNAFDVKRGKWFRRSDIAEVLDQAALVDSAAYRCIWIKAHLVSEGRISPREVGPGPALCIKDRLIKW